MVLHIAGLFCSQALALSAPADASLSPLLKASLIQAKLG